MSTLRANAALLVGASMLTVYLGFQAGGFFPDSTGVAAVAVAVALLVRVGSVPDPFGGLNWRSVAPLAAFALFALWTLASSAWSHSPSRAVLEFDRALLYLLVLVLFASLPRRRGRLAALAGGFGVGSVVLCAAGLATRTLPKVFPIAPGLANERLAYPLTYWNALGLLATLGILLCLGLSASTRLRAALRALIAATVPLLAATLLLTFSRGAIAAGVIGVVVLVAACPSRAVLLTLAATVAPAGYAIHAAYSATALATPDPSGPAAVAQGRHVLIAVGMGCVAAGLLRAGLAHWDVRRRQAARPRLDPRARRALAGAAVLTALLAGGTGAVVLGAPSALTHQYDRFIADAPTPNGQLVRGRLTDPANDHRLPGWRVALDTWRSQPLHGSGAGTFQVEWNLRRPLPQYIVNAHSLYLEVLSDLGLVGLALLVVTLLAVLAGLASRLRGPGRPVAAALLAAAVGWLVHAAVDWDWQMPVLTWWLFAAGGSALASSGRRARFADPGRLRRLLIMLAIALVGLLPGEVALSQVNLTHAVSAFKRGDCNAAVADAMSSSGAIGARPEPYELTAYCDARGGHAALALTTIQSAINRDPRNWEFWYDSAIIRGAGGLDPRAAARTALRLNPLGPLSISLARALRTTNPQLWRERAARATLLVP